MTIHNRIDPPANVARRFNILQQAQYIRTRTVAELRFVIFRDAPGLVNAFTARFAILSYTLVIERTQRPQHETKTSRRLPMFTTISKTTLAAALALSTLTSALPLSAANAASGEPIVVINSTLGPVLASAKSGFSLYTFRKDTKGLSSCLGDCIKAQPPFLASPGAQPVEQFDIIVRQDGARQWALDGRPLYFSARDRASGDAFGHGFRDVWDVVKVTGPAAQTAIAPLRKAVVPAKKVAAPVKKVVAAPAYVEPVYAAPVYAPKTYGNTYAAPAYAPTTAYSNTYAAPAYAHSSPKRPVRHVPTYKY